MSSFLDDLAQHNVIRGTVKKYFGIHRLHDFINDTMPDDSRWFGFVTVEDGREFFFHFHQGIDLFYDVHLNISTSANVRVPKPGDKIVFNTIVGSKSDKVRANHWVFENNLKDV